KPLEILIGDSEIAGGFAAFVDPRPSVLLDGNLQRSPWLTPERLRNEGALVVWRMSSPHDTPPPALVSQVKGQPFQLLPPLRVQTAWDHHIAPVLFGRGAIMPAAAR